MSEMSKAIQELPIASLIPIALLVIVGLLLWAAGRRVLKVGFAMAGLIVGGVIGWLIGAQFSIGIPPWVFAAVLGLLLACISALGFRMAVAAALGVVLGVAAPLTVVTVAEIQGIDKSVIQDDDDSGSGWDLGTKEREKDEFDLIFGSADAIDAAGGAIAPEGFDIPDGAVEKLEEVRGYAEMLLDGVKAWWAEQPDKLRPAIIASAVGGLLVGVLVGTLAPSITASVVTSFGGSLLWLFGLRVILIQMSETIAEWMPNSATASGVIWLIISIVGIVIQWIFRPKAADKPA